MITYDDFAIIRGRMRGLTVTEKRLVANTLSLVLSAAANSPGVFTIWLEPTWQVLSAHGVLAGSRQAQDEDESSGFQAVSQSLGALIGLRVEDVSHHAVTGELALSLSDGYAARTFVADPRDTDYWQVWDVSNGERYTGSAGGVATRE